MKLEVKEISKDMEFDEDAGKEEPREESYPSNDITPEQESTAETISNYTNSESIVPENGKGMFNCDKCQNKYTARGSLYNHIQQQHVGIRHTCNQCDYQSSRQGNLKLHIQSKHEGIKYTCNLCDQQFAHKHS